MKFIVATDASFHADTGVASYGICILTPQGYVKRSGVYQAPMRSSDIAELTAVANALGIINNLFNLELSEERNTIELYVDYSALTRILTGKLRPRSLSKYNTMTAYKYAMEHLKLFQSVQVTHVKAHNVRQGDDSDQITLMNNWCDIAAHGAMSLRVAELRLPKKDLTC